jgi:hypothetical protein
VSSNEFVDGSRGWRGASESLEEGALQTSGVRMPAVKDRPKADPMAAGGQAVEQ